MNVVSADWLPYCLPLKRPWLTSQGRLDERHGHLLRLRTSDGLTGWGERGQLNLALSEDGLKWHSVGELEKEPGAEFSYPAMIQVPTSQRADDTGLVHITYTWKRDRIKHVVIDPSQLK